MNPRLSNYRGQCYDGASNIASSRSGVSTQLSSEEPHAVWQTQVDIIEASLSDHDGCFRHSGGSSTTATHQQRMVTHYFFFQKN